MWNIRTTEIKTLVCVKYFLNIPYDLTTKLYVSLYITLYIKQTINMKKSLETGLETAQLHTKRYNIFCYLSCKISSSCCLTWWKLQILIQGSTQNNDHLKHVKILSFIKYTFCMSGTIYISFGLHYTNMIVFCFVLYFIIYHKKN